MFHRTDNEADRIKALERYVILGSDPDPAFERITKMVMAMFRVPVALISLVHKERVWFKSHPGTKTTETPRNESFSAQVILDRDVLVVPDAAADPRFGALPTVQAKNGYRFHAGAPLRTPDQYHIGSLCLLDTRPRYDWDEFKSKVLADLAAITVDEMEVRLRAAVSSSSVLSC